MNKERFKEIEERSGHTPTVLLFEYFREEKDSKIDLQDFQNTFQMWIMMMQPFQHYTSGVNKVVEYLKNKYK